MRQLDDITLSEEDRPAPPARAARASRRKAAPAPIAAAPAAPAPAPRPRRRRLAPVWWRRARPVVIGLAVMVAAAAPVAWAIHSGAAARAVHAVEATTVGLTAQAGMRVSAITVDGQAAGPGRTTRDQLVAALGTGVGAPIMGLDLAAMRTRLEAMPWVKHASVERRLPGQLHISIVERDPIAIWQNQGRYFLIDANGLDISPDIDAFRNLPLVVGEGAPAQTAKLLALLSTEPTLAGRVKAAQWVGERRWNIEFDQPSGGIEVRLPEDAPDAAWHDLARLDRTEKILERKLALIDMRLPDRYVLRQQPPPPAPATTPAAKPRHKGGREA